MKIFEKSLKDYWHTSKEFFIAMIALGIVQVVIAELVGNLSDSTIMIISLVVSIIALTIVFLAGFFAVRNHKFNLKQATFVGILAFLVTIWLIPFSIPIDAAQLALGNLIFVYVINTAILAALNIVIVAPVAAFGGWIAKKIK